MAKKVQRGLGRGLGALLGDAVETEETAKAPEEEKQVDEVRLIPIRLIDPNREQPRKSFDESALAELAQSIRAVGVLQPIIVCRNGERYTIIAGERRYRASRLAEKDEIPAIVRDWDDQMRLEAGLIENLQRDNLNPIEEAMAYKRLIDEFHLKQDEIAERVSKSRTAVTNSMRLLKLDSRVQQMMVDEMISAGHARAILAISDPEQQYNAAMKVFDEKLSVRETEKLVKSILTPTKKKPVVSNPTEDAIYESLEEKMKGITGTRVFIHRKKNNKGKIEIEYYSRDDLDRIIDLFESIG